MKTTIDMAREVGGYPAAATDRALLLFSESHLERFAALVRADEREACIEDIMLHAPRSGRDTPEYQRAIKIVERIRARNEQ